MIIWIFADSQLYLTCNQKLSPESIPGLFFETKQKTTKNSLIWLLLQNFVKDIFSKKTIWSSKITFERRRNHDDNLVQMSRIKKKCLELWSCFEWFVGEICYTWSRMHALLVWLLSLYFFVAATNSSFRRRLVLSSFFSFGKNDTYGSIPQLEFVIMKYV